MTLDEQLRATLDRVGRSIEESTTSRPPIVEATRPRKKQLVIAFALVVGAIGLFPLYSSFRDAGTDQTVVSPGSETRDPEAPLTDTVPPPTQASSLENVGSLSLEGRAPGSLAAWLDTAWIGVQGQGGAPSGVSVVDLAKAKETHFIELDGPLEHVQADQGRAWGVVYRGSRPPYDPTLVSLDSTTVVGELVGLDGPLVPDSSGLWATVRSAESQFVHVDRDSLTIDAAIPLPVPIRDGVATDKGLWVVDKPAQSLFLLDTADGAVLREINTSSGAMLDNLVTDGGAVWTRVIPQRSGDATLLVIRGQSASPESVVATTGTPIAANRSGAWVVDERGVVSFISREGTEGASLDTRALPSQTALEPTVVLRPNGTLVISAADMQVEIFSITGLQ